MDINNAINQLQQSSADFMENYCVVNGNIWRITSMPSLIICGNNSIVKTNGMPYAIKLEVDGEFTWMASYRRNPIVLLLELLWTRLTYQYGLSTGIFGDELFDEGLVLVFQ